jgi:putative ATPase
MPNKTGISVFVRFLFVDEIHRFNKAQQDAFLPHVESGLLSLIGATTENPSFEVITPLLSRMRVVVLNPLSKDEMKQVIQRATRDLQTKQANCSRCG